MILAFQVPEMFNWLFRRLGYVRLRDYNLRIGADGVLVPIDRNEPTPIDFGLTPTYPLQSGKHLQSTRLGEFGPYFEIAQGTADGLRSQDPAASLEAAPVPLHPYGGEPLYTETHTEPNASQSGSSSVDKASADPDIHWK